MHCGYFIKVACAYTGGGTNMNFGYPKFIFVPLPVDAQMALTVHLNALYNRRMECKGFGSLRKASKKMELNIHFLIEVPLLPFPLIN
jgi:hypothetical protein